MNFEILERVSENQSISQISIKPKKFSKSSGSFEKKWTVAQNILYARYLKTHMGQMNNQKKKKSGKFIKMANFVGSKSQNQCRSHHQKMVLTYKSIQTIIKYVAEVKKRGQLLSIEEYQQIQGIDLQNSDNLPIQNKIEEQISTQRQSQQEIKQEKKIENQTKEMMLSDFTLVEEESKQFQAQHYEGELFDVLSIDVVDKYSQFFTF